MRPTIATARIGKSAQPRKTVKSARQIAPATIGKNVKTATAQIARPLAAIERIAIALKIATWIGKLHP